MINFKLQNEIKKLKRKQKELTNEQLTHKIISLAEKHNVDPMYIFLKLELGEK